MGYEEGEFPNRLLRILGWSLVVLGVITMCLGVLDIGWTAGNYVGNNCDNNNQFFDSSVLSMPCDHDSLLWTWIAAPVWASLFIIITGIVGTRFSSWRTESRKNHRDLFAIGCALICIIWGPVIIVIASLEVFYGGNVFYYLNNTDVMQFGDVAKVVIPLLIIVFDFFAWIIAIIGVCVACCCAPVDDTPFEPMPIRQSMRSYRSAPVMPRPRPRLPPQAIPVPVTSYPYYGQSYGYGYGGGYPYPYYGAGYNNYGYQPTAQVAAAQPVGGSLYGGAGKPTYSGLANALMPYSGTYGGAGAAYGAYTAQDYARNPYI